MFSEDLSIIVCTNGHNYSTVACGLQFQSLRVRGALRRHLTGNSYILVYILHSRHAYPLYCLILLTLCKTCGFMCDFELAGYRRNFQHMYSRTSLVLLRVRQCEKMHYQVTKKSAVIPRLPPTQSHVCACYSYYVTLSTKVS